MTLNGFSDFVSKCVTVFFGAHYQRISSPSGLFGFFCFELAYFCDYSDHG